MNNYQSLGTHFAKLIEQGNVPVAKFGMYAWHTVECANCDHVFLPDTEGQYTGPRVGPPRLTIRETDLTALFGVARNCECGSDLAFAFSVYERVV